MSGLLFYVAMGACLVTAAVLIVGIGGFGSGKASARFSQKMMRLRIVAQFVALVAIMATIWVARQGG